MRDRAELLRRRHHDLKRHQRARIHARARAARASPPAKSSSSLDAATAVIIPARKRRRSSVRSLVIRLSSEREGERLDPRIQELDLEGAIHDGAGLADEVIEAR